MKFTPPSELNDPSELVPKFSIPEVLDSLRDLRERGHSESELRGLHQQAALMRELAPEQIALHAPRTAREADEYIRLPYYDNIELLERLFSGLVDTISTRVGVSCLTKRWNSLPMWAHYANRGRGLVLAYRKLDQVFRGDDTGWLNCVRQINYSRELEGITFYPDSYSNIFFAKFSDWQYELEFRIVSKLDDCQRFGDPNSGSYVRSVPQSCLRAIILGWRMPEHDKRLALQVIDVADLDSLDVYDARIRRGEVELAKI